jgi:hypothetical protein
MTEQELSSMHLSSTLDPQKWLDEKLNTKPDAKVLIITREATRIAII